MIWTVLNLSNMHYDINEEMDPADESLLNHL